MNTLTWVIAGAGAGYLLLLLWLIRRNRRGTVPAEADCGIRAIEQYLKQEAAKK